MRMLIEYTNGKRQMIFHPDEIMPGIAFKVIEMEYECDNQAAARAIIYTLIGGLLVLAGILIHWRWG